MLLKFFSSEGMEPLKNALNAPLAKLVIAQIDRQSEENRSIT